MTRAQKRITLYVPRAHVAHLRMAQAKQRDIEEKLTQLRREGEEREAQRLAESLGLSYVDPISAPVELDAIRLIPEEEARAARVAAIEKKQRSIVVIAADPESSKARAVLDRLTAAGYEVRVLVSSQSGLEHAWASYAHISKAPEKITDEISVSAENILVFQKTFATLDTVRTAFSPLPRELSVSDMVAQIFAAAIILRASDVHFEPAADAVRLRYRIDGILNDISTSLLHEAYALVLSRMKLVSGLKLNVTREAQDGRFTIRYGDRNIDVRVSSTPSEHGETVVCRLLDPAAATIGLEEIGLREDDLAIIEAELRRPNGMILTTGPTGSGKTTTLYAFLRHTQSSETKTITIEDPIEYHLEGIEQTQVDPDAGYTFASGLRSLMRQDPDVLLIGEIRDSETAEIAIQAALTGHLVFSTVHANESVGAITRLADLNVPRPSIGSAVNLILGQRLVRRLCEQCRAPQEVLPELRTAIEAFVARLPKRVDRARYTTPTLFTAPGCAACHGSGYTGRVGIYEALQVNSAVQQMVEEGASERVIAGHLRSEQGMVSLQEDGILKALRGATSLEEVERVTGQIRWGPPDT